ERARIEAAQPGSHRLGCAAPDLSFPISRDRAAHWPAKYEDSLPARQARRCLCAAIHGVIRRRAFHCVAPFSNWRFSLRTLTSKLIPAGFANGRVYNRDCIRPAAILV